MVVQVIASVTTTLLILMVSFFMVQRFSNSPGNIAWPIMCFTHASSPLYSSALSVVGVLTLVVLLLTLTANIIAFVRGITSVVKKIVFLLWVAALVIMLVA